MAGKRKYKTDVLNCRISPELKAFIESIAELEGITISEWAVRAYKNAIGKFSEYISTAPKIKYHKLCTIYLNKRKELIQQGRILPGQKPRYLHDESIEIDKVQLNNDLSLLPKKEQVMHLGNVITFKVSQIEYDKIHEASDKFDLTMSEFIRRAIKKVIEDFDK
jgi:hypothetical protein